MRIRLGCGAHLCAALLSIASLLGGAPGALAQNAGTGSEFWLAPPDVTDLNGAPGGVPISLVLHANDVGGPATVDQPAGGGMGSMLVTVFANQSVRLNLSAFKNSLETRPTNVISNSGLRIQSFGPLTAYYEIATPTNTAMLALKGPDALGREFLIPLQKYSPFFNESAYFAPDQAIATFDIVATQPTTVWIYSPVPLDGHPALQQFAVSLNRGQTYSAGYSGSNWSQPFNHPSGAVVLADQPVAVTVKDDSVHNPSGSCTSLLSEQLVPVDALGTDYIAVKGLLNNGAHESVVIVAPENDTQIFRDGAAMPLATLFAGENFRLDMDYLGSGPTNATYIHASAPVYATHISGFGCAMAMAQLPRLNVAGSHSVDLVRDDAQAFDLLLVTRAEAVNGFTVTGDSSAVISAASFLPVPGTAGEWMAARIAFSTAEIPANATFRVSNSSGLFSLAVLSGGTATGARYGYFSRYRGRIGLTANANATPAAVPAGGGPVTITLQVENTGDTDAALTSLSDSWLGNLDGRGSCALPQTLAPAASYECSFSRVASGQVGDVQTDDIVVSGVSYDAAVGASAAASVTFFDEIFADGFE